MNPSRRCRAIAGVGVAVLLAGCGVVPAAAPSPSDVVPSPSPTGGSSPAPTAALTTTPTATPTAAPTAARTAAPSTSPSIASPTPREQARASWTGKFRGHTVTIPYGHGAPVSFTFDDGPSPTYTPQVLALLARHHAPAVFCLIGDEARSYPALVRREVRAGHRLCDHSRDHDLDMNAKGKAYVTAEIDDGLAEIRAAAPGAPVSYYRQPGGYWSLTVVAAMNRADLYPLRWSDDPKDWSRPGSAKIVRRVVKHLHPGVVILLHDGGGDRSQTVEALAWLLQALPAAGWKPVLAPKKRLSAKAAAKPQ